MSMESDVVAALTSLVSGRVYPSVAPSNPTKPYIVYTGAGGVAFNFLESAAVGLRNSRLQVSCWATTRMAANALAIAAENALIASALKAYVLGAMQTPYDEQTKLYGTHQDFSVFYTPV